MCGSDSAYLEVITIWLARDVDAGVAVSQVAVVAGFACELQRVLQHLRREAFKHLVEDVIVSLARNLMNHAGLLQQVLFNRSARNVPIFRKYDFDELYKHTRSTVQ